MASQSNVPVTAQDVHTMQFVTGKLSYPLPRTLASVANQIHTELISSVYLPTPTCKLYLAYSPANAHTPSPHWRAAVMRSAHGMWKFVSPTYSGNTRTEAMVGLLEWLEAFADDMMGWCEAYVEVDALGRVVGKYGQPAGGGERKKMGMPDVLFEMKDIHEKRLEALGNTSLGSTSGMGMDVGMGMSRQPATPQNNMNMLNDMQSFGGLQQQQHRLQQQLRHQQLQLQQQRQQQYFATQPANLLNPFSTLSFPTPQQNRTVSLHPQPGSHHRSIHDTAGFTPAQHHTLLQALKPGPQQTLQQDPGLTPQQLEQLMLSSPPTLRNRSSTIGDVTDMDDVKIDMGTGAGMYMESMDEYTRRLNPQRQTQFPTQSQPFGLDSAIHHMGFGATGLGSAEDVGMQQEEDVTVLEERKAETMASDIGGVSSAGEQGIASGSGHAASTRQSNFVQQARKGAGQTARKGPAGPDFGKTKSTTTKNGKKKRGSKK